MSDQTSADPKTKALFELLDLSDPSKRQRFVEMGSAGLPSLTKELPAHFRLDSMTASSDEDEGDAKLA